MPETSKRSQTEKGLSTIAHNNRVQMTSETRQSTKKPKGYKSKAQSTNEDNTESEETCLICANNIKYAAYSQCHHVTCHLCTFRQRVLYGKNQCLVCRSEDQAMIFSDKLDHDYDMFDLKASFKYDSKYLVHFVNKRVYDDTQKLLQNKCSQCANSFETFKKLSEHVKSVHNRVFCLICSKNKKAFVNELPLYSYKQLQRHQTEGDKSGFKGHPECRHCKGKRFYSEDELNIHIRDRHERCYICDQDMPHNADYFNNYDDLYNHFKNTHYVCSVPSCVEKKFVVFREDLDLTAHMLKEHGGITGNNRIVLGSSSRDFQSQLSTFRNSNTNSNNNPRSEENSPSTKKKRFEERAKHYLSYVNSDFQLFININNNFKMGETTSQELLYSYKQLFKNQNDQDLHLLIFDFSQLFPSSSPLNKVLADLSNELIKSVQGDAFPVLGGSSRSGSPGTFHSWSSNGSGKKRQDDSFPVLEKPKPRTAPLKSQLTSNKTMKYNAITEDKRGNTRSVFVSNEQAASNYRPTYLARSGSSSSSSPVSQVQGSSSSANSPNLPEDKFPALLKKQTKKPIPRVKQYDIADPNLWSTQSQPKEPDSIEGSEDENMDKRKQKLKKKQQKLLFTTL